MVPIGRIACEARREVARVADGAISFEEAQDLRDATRKRPRRVRSARRGARAG
jgi:hypothetical protein